MERGRSDVDFPCEIWTDNEERGKRRFCRCSYEVVTGDMIHNEAIRQIITEWKIYVWMKGKEEMDIHALRG